MLKAPVIGSCLLAMLCAGGALGGEDEREGETIEKPSGYVSMALSSASFLPKGAWLECKVTLINDTGAELVGESEFANPSMHYSLELVITDKNGIVQLQKRYADSRSPQFLPAREVTLPRGETTYTLRFPIYAVELLPSTIKVRLVGVLHATNYSRICSTETIELSVPKTASGSEKSAEHVSMVLSSASFAPKESEVRCKVTLVNDTGTEQIVQSVLDGPSVYDYMELVITDKNGIVQRQICYWFHRDPSFSSKTKEPTLARGETAGTLIFPLENLDSLPSVIKVRLVGTLPEASIEESVQPRRSSCPCRRARTATQTVAQAAHLRNSKDLANVCRSIKRWIVRMGRTTNKILPRAA